MNELLRCPFCGEEPHIWGGATEHSEIVQCLHPHCPIHHVEMMRSTWQSRRTFVCNDRHGKSVFEGDPVWLDGCGTFIVRDESSLSWMVSDGRPLSQVRSRIELAGD